MIPVRCDICGKPLEGLSMHRDTRWRRPGSGSGPMFFCDKHSGTGGPSIQGGSFWYYRLKPPERMDKRICTPKALPRLWDAETEAEE